MGEVIKFKRPSLAERHRKKALCRSGFHRWEVVDRPFDVKTGKLITHYRCARCGTTRTEAQ